MKEEFVDQDGVYYANKEQLKNVYYRTIKTYINYGKKRKEDGRFAKARSKLHEIEVYGYQSELQSMWGHIGG